MASNIGTAVPATNNIVSGSGPVVNANKFYKSASPPSRQWMMGSVSRLSNPARATRPIHPMRAVRESNLIGTTAAIAPPAPRRSSAAGIGHQRPPLPPAMLVGNRCQSLDELVDTADGASIAAVANTVVVAAAISSSDIEGAPENQNNTQRQLLEVAPKPNPRRSRSFDDLLEVDVPSTASSLSAAAGDHSQSVECLSDTPQISTDDGSAAECPRDTESMTVHNSRAMSVDDNSSSSTLSGETAGGTSSRMQMQPQSQQRTLLNRYVKKVKSFIKK